MTTQEQISPKDLAAIELAMRHFELEDGLVRVFRVHGSMAAEMRPGEPIKLLEVNEATSPSGVIPLYFGPIPARGINFPSVIIEVTPAEFEKIKASELVLPDGWTIGDEIRRTNG
jgi:hypothetical protein